MGPEPAGPEPTRRFRPRWPWPRTLRARATAAAVLTMVLALAVGGGWLYLTLRDNVLDNAADRTELAARQTVAALMTGKDELPSDLPEPDDGVDAVLVLDARGRALASTAPDPAARAARLADFRPARGEDSAVRELSESEAAASHRSVVAVVRAPSPQGDRYVYALTMLNAESDASHALAVTLLVGGPLVVVLTGLISWSVTGSALRPVEAIRRELAAVTADRLSRRVPAPGGKDEITRLARTVNDTLERLERSVTLQRQFVADASHELRNPIAAVRAELELALLRQDPEETVASLRQALASTVRLERIAADLLLLARLDAQQAPKAPQTAATPLVDLSLLTAEEIARRRSARVPLRLTADEPVSVRGDSGQLERLLANLLDNAQRFAVSEVRVTTRTDPASGTAVLEVADDGPGIPPEAAEKVFDRFARLEEDRNRDRGGTGLGLAIAREIAQAHGGSLRVAPGPHGALLVLRLPAADV
ncbi:sensor histidine kinase [Streptomyces formicae]|uniref:histidine kinase n=1 Tax=Streptomyces formicae TaxID=1616117 RepID=A0A291Q333_9ACTN|nr:HAMP domain-containing sensor histidine kinase [Streptomyces formicae]ATL25895.1 putative two-component sensor kinase [Streptomyces formicae]